MNSMTLRPILFATILASSLLWNGCDSTDSGSGPTGGSTGALLIDACTLLDTAEAAVIMGKPVLSIKRDTTSNYISSCTYTGSKNPGSILATRIYFDVLTTAGMQAHFNSTASAFTAAGFFHTMDSSAVDTSKTALAGIGTQAVWLIKPAKLTFYKGNAAMDITYNPNGMPVFDNSPAAFEGAKAIAIKAAARL